MNKLIAMLVLSSALAAFADGTSQAAVSSNSGKPVVTPRSRCLTLVAKVLNQNLKLCQNKNGPHWTNCKQNAYSTAKAERAACPAAKSD